MQDKDQEKNKALQDTYELLGDISMPWNRASWWPAFIHSVLLVVVANLFLIAPLVLGRTTSDASPPWEIAIKPTGHAGPVTGERAYDREIAPRKEVEELEQALKSLCTGDSCGIWEFSQRMALRDRRLELEKTAREAVAEDGERDLAATRAAWNREVRFATALVLGLIFTMCAAFAQTRAAVRYWHASLDPESTYKPPFITYLFLVLLAAVLIPLPIVFWPSAVAVLILLAFIWMDRPPSDHAPLRLGALAFVAGCFLSSSLFSNLDLLPGEAGTLGWLTYIGATALIAFLSVHLAIAGFLCHAAAESFPTVIRAQKFRLDVKKKIWVLAHGSEYREAPKSPSDVKLWKALLDWRGNQKSATNVPIIASFTADQAAEIVEDVSRLLAINLIAILFVAALGIEMLAGDLPSSDVLSAAVSDSKSSWLYMVTGAATLSLAYIYVWPATRLRPFQEAEALIKAKLSDPLTGKGTMTVEQTHFYGLTFARSFELPFEPRNELRVPGDFEEVHKAERELEKATGCTAKKLDVLFYAGQRGGSLQELMQMPSGEWLKKLATFLAPAFATGIIAVLT